MPPLPPERIERSKMPAKTATQSHSLIIKPALAENCNALSHLLAGHVLKLIDVAGVIPAFRHVDGRHSFVTASLDRTNFISPIRAWETFRIDSR